MGSLKNRILAAKMRLESIMVPEWGETVWLKRMTGSEQDVYQAAQIKAGDEQKTKGQGALLGLQPLLLSLTLCDESGKRLFDDVRSRFPEMAGIIQQYEKST